MTTFERVAKHLREVYFGKNWTAVNMKDTCADITWQEATTQVYGLNTIATLLQHSNYYINGVLPVMDGGALTIKDKLSFAHTPINSQEDWETFITTRLNEVEVLASKIEKIDDSKLGEDFDKPIYGDHYRNLSGLVEHTHYHLGQIMFLKKIIRTQNAS